MIQRKFTLVTVALFAILQLQLNAQLYKGNVVSTNDKIAIAYVNIGIVGKDVGTVSNNNGEFSIELLDLYNNDSLRFSILGYKTKSFKVADFKKQFAHNAITIPLETKLMELKTVLIKPKKTKILGNKTETKMMICGFISDDLGSEVGTVMKIKGVPTIIDSTSFFIVENKYGKLKFRLNIYKMENGEPGQSILKDNIFIETAIKQGRVTVDLTPYYLVVNDDFLVSLEWIENLGEKGLYFPLGFLNNPSFSRKTSQSQWKKQAFGMGIYTYVRY
ncbi:MAG: hypothetical protein AUJ97_05160 [Bacteroidetes bacterium CG2_30_32_10]|nr:MAG: hypothetical protein AUJ97_05160 [Bacteroidetes bacterium CG2_30_32_10]